MWVTHRYQTWLELVEDLIAQHSSSFPRARVQDELASTFDTVVSWNWENSDGSYGWEVSIDGWPTDEIVEAFHNGGRHLHPLVHWFRATGDPRPMTIGRVPRSLIPRGGLEVTRDLSPPGLVQQLSIPHDLGPGYYRAFVAAKDEDDFCDEAFQLAGLIGPLLALLDLHTSQVSRSPDPDAAATWSLTGREQVVLQLLADGLTAQTIGHQLGISPRTVHCHLANLYRKMGVSDRMRAVLLAQEAGLLDPRQRAL